MAQLTKEQIDQLLADPDACKRIMAVAKAAPRKTMKMKVLESLRGIVKIYPSMGKQTLVQLAKQAWDEEHPNGSIWQMRGPQKFLKENMAKIREENPGMSSQEVFKMAHAMRKANPAPAAPAAPAAPMIEASPPLQEEEPDEWVLGGNGAGEDSDAESTDIENDFEPCEACGKTQSSKTMLLCDGCGKGYHMKCLMPPVHEIPKGDWLCPHCPAGNAKKTRKTRKR
jgi:hypothetical protein